MNNEPEFMLYELDTERSSGKHPQYKLTRNGQLFCYAESRHIAATGVMAILSSEGRVKPLAEDT